MIGRCADWVAKGIGLITWVVLERGRRVWRRLIILWTEEGFRLVLDCWDNWFIILFVTQKLNFWFFYYIGESFMVEENILFLIL